MVRRVPGAWLTRWQALPATSPAMKLRVTAYIVLLLGLLVVLAFRINADELVRDRLVTARLIPPRSNVTDPSRAPMLAVYDRTDHLVPAGATVLIGDSIVFRAPFAGPCIANRGIGGERSDQLLANLDRWPSIDRAGAVVIAIGTNDVWQRRPEGLGKRVSAILDRIEAPAYLLGLGSDLEGIDEANRELRRACRDNCTFVDPPKLLLDDGIHPAPQSYAELARQLPLDCRRPA